MNTRFKRQSSLNFRNDKRVFEKIILLSFIYFFLGSCSACKKSNPLPEFYFTCKINGQDYVPDNCANCRVANILGDTTFLLNGNNGFETVSFGIIKLDHIPIQVYSYLLNNPQQSGTYKNSTTVTDKFITDSLNTGNLTISGMDKVNKIIVGSFSFKGYNAYQDKTVTVSDGKFRLKYGIY